MLFRSWGCWALVGPPGGHCSAAENVKGPEDKPPALQEPAADFPAQVSGGWSGLLGRCGQESHSPVEWLLLSSPRGFGAQPGSAPPQAAVPLPTVSRQLLGFESETSLGQRSLPGTRGTRGPASLRRTVPIGLGGPPGKVRKPSYKELC